MAGVSLDTFKMALGRGASWRDTRRCVVLAIGQASAMVAKPVDAPSTWSRLFGKSWLYGKMFGRESYRKDRLDDQLTTLHAFKAALVDEYGPVIAQAAFRSIRSREVLRLSDARAALEVARQAAGTSHRLNAETLEKVLAGPRTFDFERQREPDEPSSEQLRDLTLARLGPAFSRVHLSEGLIESNFGEVLEMVRLGLTSERADRLLNAMTDRSSHEQLQLFSKEREFLRASHANEQAVLNAIARSATRAEHKGIPAATVHTPPADEAVFTKALLQAVLAPQPDAVLDDGGVDAAAALAVSLRETLSRAPDMPRARALEILRFAAAAPQAQRQAVVDALCGDRQASDLFDARGVLAGSEVGKYVQHDFSSAGLLDGMRDIFRTNLEQTKTSSFTSDTGESYELSQTACKDAARSDFVIGATPLPKSAEQFPGAFRGRFAKGPAGDAAARAVSCCMNQNNMNHLVGYVAGKAFLPVQKRGFNTLHEASALEGGAWSVRSTFQVAIQAASTARGEVVTFRHPASAMYVLDYRVTPDPSSGSKYHIECVGADVVFASSTLSTEPQSPADASSQGAA